MVHRIARHLLLGLYLATGLLAGAMPHADGCGARPHAAHDHDAQLAAGWDSAHADSHDDNCVTCKFLSLRYVQAAVSAELPLASQVDVLAISVPALTLERPCSLHDARGPPLG